ncbi:putative transcription factor ZF-HD family [Medicago truncatula]|uniref:Homeobox domain, ZF-HD class protein n=1 Tax=Medicago truncatula TaxID=3880 RepID=G7L6E4_MEDTR|nr:zinc-finger homeodomain protein 4 [Medicago truncatula]AFK37422.1 unknown [Medicago truncatula]KEH42846.1 homeobox domain, ZF-HD class protein [Medicago truncatula]RHN80454.1 putative transcription factor ZF-HD family [Medicago truncatula]
MEKKIVVKYKECLKNHAATIGGNAIDGCGEFMPSGENDTLEALKCCACNCHRNFHRKEIESDFNSPSQHYANLSLIPDHNINAPFLAHFSPNNKSESTSPSDQSYYEKDFIKDVENRTEKMILKKRSRTKFSKEQKEKMLCFAEKAEWRIQKLEESVVQKFCQEIGIKRRILKVWMHNNKNTFAKRNLSTS